jgi:hypothetical protein
MLAAAGVRPLQRGSENTRKVLKILDFAPDKQMVFAPKWTHEESSILTALIFTFEVVGLGPI